MVKRSRSAGFTLVEMLVVLVILGLLVGLVGPRVLGYLGGAKTDTAQIQIKQIETALELYRIDTGTIPTADQGLLALMADPGGVSGWNGPYLKAKSVPVDPWGAPYQYLVDRGTGAISLISLGADKAEGGEGENADISN